MTAEIIHPGHILCIRFLEDKCDELIVGLLTEKALEGYKQCAVPFKDRKYVLQSIVNPYNKVVAQESLNPEENLKLYKPEAVASGDGWEKEETEALEKLAIQKYDIPFKKLYSSSSIKAQIIKQNKEICQR